MCGCLDGLSRHGDCLSVCLERLFQYFNILSRYLDYMVDCMSRCAESLFVKSQWFKGLHIHSSCLDNAYFWKCWAATWIYFPILIQCKIWNISIFQARSSAPEVDMCTHWLFCTKFNSEQILFEQFFNIIVNFGCVQPESDSTFLFQCIIICIFRNMSTYTSNLLCGCIMICRSATTWFSIWLCTKRLPLILD